MSTPSTLKTQIQSLIDTSNATTGKKDATLTDAINSLVDGYGGSSDESFDFIRVVSFFNVNGLGVFDTEEVVLNLDNLNSLNRCIYCEWGKGEYPNTKVKHLILNCKLPIENARQAFYHPNGYTNALDTKIEQITLNVDFSKAINMLNLISNFSALKVIDGTPLDFSSSTINGNVLYRCDNVEEVLFVPNSIKVSISVAHAKNLSSESVQSLIDGLADLTGSDAQTLTVHAEVEARMTEEQKATITSKNWTLAVA